MKDNTYHRILRIASLVCALALVFESGLVYKSTAVISANAHLYLANAVGMSASVQPTELNRLTADLAAREHDLAAREAALTERNISIGLSDGSSSNDKATFVLAAILFILLVLILLNYALDYLRLKEERPPRTV
ncbi:MAG: hypothetical protein LR008_03140 [Candidatus Pacebacteria bacterium]|nr:hypothetical protein [Candidatus Paceibacterota bacterium]